MIKEPHASLVIDGILDYCRSCPSYLEQRLTASLRRLKAQLPAEELVEIELRVRRQLGLAAAISA
jgi:hypothetical protein